MPEVRALARSLSILLLAGFLPLAAQDPMPSPSDATTYEPFFQIVTSYKSASDVPVLLINGEPVKRPAFRKLQDIIGLTDNEVETLLSTASDCLAPRSRRGKHKYSNCASK